MNRHLAINISCFSVVKLRNSPAQYSVMARIPRLEAEHFNHNLLNPDLFRGSLDIDEDGYEQILWHAYDNDKAITFDVYPYTSFWRRPGLSIMSLLPIESKL